MMCVIQGCQLLEFREGYHELIISHTLHLQPLNTCTVLILIRDAVPSIDKAYNVMFYANLTSDQSRIIANQKNMVRLELFNANHHEIKFDKGACIGLATKLQNFPLKILEPKDASLHTVKVPLGQLNKVNGEPQENQQEKE